MMSCLRIIFIFFLLKLAYSTSTYAGSKPNIIFIMTDDQGYGNVGYHNSSMITPNINNLVSKGVRLERHYVYKFCSPTRSAFLSGRLPIHVNQENSSTTQAGAGVPLEYNLISNKLKLAGYETHAIGKWHIGQSTYDKSIPIARGFDTHLGYFNWGEDHYTQIRGSQGCAPNDPIFVKNTVKDNVNCAGVDLWLSNSTYNGPAYEYNGSYGGYLYANYAEKTIKSSKNSGKPFFIYLAFQNAHAPLEVPKKYTNMYPNGMKYSYNGMNTFIDDAIGNITNLLKENDLYDNTLIVYSSDNGATIDSQQQNANNMQLKGWKFDDFEGGVRVNSFVSGGFLPEYIHGTILDGPTSYIHIVDWYPTFCYLAGVDPDDKQKTGLYNIDGYNIWPLIIQTNTTSPRIEIPLSALPWGPDTIESKKYYKNRGKLLYAKYNTVNIKNELMSGPLGYWVSGEGYILNEYKLVTGQQRVDWQNTSQLIQDCGNGCLYNIINDPNEIHDLANLTEFKNILVKMQNNLAEYRKQVYAPNRGPEDENACKALVENGGYWTPWLNSSNCTYCI